MQLVGRSRVIINQPENNKHFLWKYIDLHQLIFFLREGSLFFNRLDKYEDPFEGITTSILKNEVKRLKKKESVRKLKAWLKTEGTAEMQKNQFVNCWFNYDRESMAMWNLFSNPDSVAIKIKFSDLMQHLRYSFDELMTDLKGDAEIIGDRIQYLKLNPFDMEQDLRRLAYSALRKDIAFEHEKEYRFLVKIGNKTKLRLSFLKLKLPEFSGMQFEIVTHPKMDDWKRKNIQPLLDIYRLPFKVRHSDIRLK